MKASQQQPQDNMSFQDNNEFNQIDSEEEKAPKMQIDDESDHYTDTFQSDDELVENSKQEEQKEP